MYMVMYVSFFTGKRLPVRRGAQPYSYLFSTDVVSHNLPALWQPLYPKFKLICKDLFALYFDACTKAI